MTTEKQELGKIVKEAKNRGWLMEADSKLPSAVTVIVGKPVKGSWWGHAKGNLIYNTCNMLYYEKDLICLKLINGKRTYLHRQYWNLIYNLIQSNQKDLEKSISAKAKKIFKDVEKKKLLRADESGNAKAYALMKPSLKELEKTVLCCSQSVHTESGFHATELISWSKVFKDRDFSVKKLTDGEIQKQTEEFKNGFAELIKFPWD